MAISDVEFTGNEEDLTEEEPSPEDIEKMEQEKEEPDVDVLELTSIQASRKELEQRSMDLIDRLTGVATDFEIQDKDAMRKTIKNELTTVAKQIKDLSRAEIEIIERIKKKSDVSEPRLAGSVSEEDIPQIGPRVPSRVSAEDESEFESPEDYEQEENFRYITGQLKLN